MEGDTWQGDKLDPGEIDKMSGIDPATSDITCDRHCWHKLIVTGPSQSDQQIGQLYELMLSIKNPQNDGKGPGEDSNTPPRA